MRIASLAASALLVLAANLEVVRGDAKRMVRGKNLGADSQIDDSVRMVVAGLVCVVV
jgi:hypothetical protein